MSIHVHRDGARQITVRDVDGRQVVLISHDRTLEVSTAGASPHLTPQMAQDLAEELQQWATCQQTVRSRRPQDQAPDTPSGVVDTVIEPAPSETAGS